jgi:triacylglycerol lipase
MSRTQQMGAGAKWGRAGALGAALLAVALLAGAAAPAQARHPVSYDFSKAPLAQSQAPNSPPPGANDFSCVPSAAHPEPVVLVHGLLANQTVNWQTYSPLLANRGYCVFSLTYGTKPDVVFPGYQPGGLRKMEESATELGAFVEQVLAATGAAEVDIVGHSEGSLMPNYYVKYLGGAARVDDYVGITPLWHGTDPAGLATLDRLSRALGLPANSLPVIDSTCESCRQFLAGSEFIAKMRAGGVAAPGVTYTNLITRNDELVVPYTSGIEEGMANIIVQQQCLLDQAEHVSMAADPVVTQDILNALDPAHAQRPPCTLVLPLLGAPAYTGPPR